MKKIQRLYNIECINYLSYLTGDELLESIEEIRNDLPPIPIYITGKSQADLPEGYHSLTDQLVRTQPVPICKTMRETVPALHPCCFIYTSGTTGKCVQNYTGNKEIKIKQRLFFSV